MKATGIVRRIDELGRVVIPKEIRRTQRIRRGDPLEIFTTGDGEVIFKKYSPMGEVNTLAAQLAEVLSRQFALTAFVCDRDRILAVSGSGRRELADRSISQPLEKLMEARKPYQSPGNPEKTLLPCEGAPRVLLCAAPVLARTTLRADPACLLVPRGHPFWEKERIPLAELRGQRVLLPSLRQDLFSPLWAACARAGFAPNAEIGPSFYQAYYLVQEQLCTCLTRYEPGARRELDRVRDVLLEDLPPLCVSLVQRRDYTSAYIDLLRSYLMEVLGGSASLPPRRGRPAKPFYNFPVLSSAAAKAAPAHPVPGTQLDFAGGTNFRELGGYEADEGKHVKWGQIWRGIPTCKLTGEADRAKLDALGLRLILDLRSVEEAKKEPDYVPDGARLVQICGLRDATGQEIDFSPNDIQRLVQSAPAGMSLTQLMYRQMLTGNKAFKELFRALEAGETPILFHCTAGKDRTGVAAMLILLALGASDETICADYARTNLCRAAEIEKAMADHAAEIAADPAQRMRWQSSAGVDPETAPFVLRTIRQDYGSAESYLEAEYGLTPARLMRLRRMYLE